MLIRDPHQIQVLEKIVLIRDPHGPDLKGGVFIPNWAVAVGKLQSLFY